MLKALLFALLTLLCFCSQNCEPFGPRLSLGDLYFSPSNQLLRIVFNTKSSCENSFITVRQGPTIRNISCSVKKLEITNKTTFTTHIHNCSVQQLLVGKPFQYDIYGVDSAGTILRYGEQSIVTQMVDPRGIGPLQFVVLADWGCIEKSPYTPLTQSFNVLLSQNKSEIHGMILNGDYAYDFESKECDNYVKFLKLLSQVSAVWPLIISSGNHEHRTVNNHRLFVESFQLYNHSDLLFQSYLFRNLQIFTFDPYEVVLGNYTKDDTQRFVERARAELVRTAGMTPFRIACSHYAAFCSYTSKSCKFNDTDFSLFLDLFNDQKIDLYFGAHTHMYERQYPYYKGRTLKVEGPYINIDSMVTVVEGVAGNDQDMIQESYPYKSYTATGLSNQTGFGLVTVFNETMMQFRHFSTKGGLHQFDSVLIGKSRRSHLTLRREGGVEE